MILRGLWLLVRGKAAGIKEFGNTPDAVAASLAPLIAFPLVGAAALALHGQALDGALDFVSRLCAVLALPLVTYEMARLTGRGAEWMRTVAALNWSFWALLPLLIIAAAIGAGAVEAGMAEPRAEHLALGLLVGYLLWFQWFIIRAGLRLGVFAAALLVLLNTGAIALLSAAPLLLQKLPLITS